MILNTPNSRVQRVRHEPKLRDLQVLRVNSLSPHFKSITFSGSALDDFVSLSFDDHVKFIINADGTEPVRRDYTPRHYNSAARELTIEFAIHSEGPVAQWAAQAIPGQQVTIGGPRSSLIIPPDYAWHLLVGDESALPAIHRRLEELPSSTRAIVVIHVNNVADRRELQSAADLSLHWVSSSESLLAFVEQLQLPLGEGYAWCAGEATLMSSLRRILVEVKALDRHVMRVAAYWKRGADAHHENLDG